MAELLNESSEETLTTIARIFTEVMEPGAKVPDYWKKSSIRVLFKKGDSKSPENYRPIYIIPILYKLFSKVLAGRLKGILNSQQSPDQAGFRPDFSCDDNKRAMNSIVHYGWQPWTSKRHLAPFITQALMSPPLRKTYPQLMSAY